MDIFFSQGWLYCPMVIENWERTHSNGNQPYVLSKWPKIFKSKQLQAEISKGDESFPGRNFDGREVGGEEELPE